MNGLLKHCAFASVFVLWNISALAVGDMSDPLMRMVDIDAGDSAEIALCDGTKAVVELLGVTEKRDPLRNALREARVEVRVNGEHAVLTSANYHLPVLAGGVQIDCPAVKGLAENATKTPWNLQKDARFRLWPAASPLIRPGTFRYPAQQLWFAGKTQGCNVSTYVDGGDVAKSKKIYYHYGFDIGGSEGMVEVDTATDGVVVVAGLNAAEGDPFAGNVRYDVVYIRDARGWYYRYSHLKEIDPAMEVGAVVKIGQRVGVLGKEGGSGGWSHLHFGISVPLPDGGYAETDAYALLFEAYRAEFGLQLQAVARPHLFGTPGETMVLDASNSWSADGTIASYTWQLGNGETREGVRTEVRYERPGTYSEMLTVTDAAGRVSHDFAAVCIVNGENEDEEPPSIQGNYAPTRDLKAGQPITFKVRGFNIAPDDGWEVWDFGDGSAPVRVRSDANQDVHAPDGFAATQHAYAKPGGYVATVSRTNHRGETATERLWLAIGAAE